MMIYLSFRGTEVKVPNLIGKAEAEAEKLLDAEGLRFKVRYRASEDTPQARLIGDQTPSPGTTVKVGQVVIVSLGTDPNKEATMAEAKPTATPTPKPKPKPKPSPSPQEIEATGAKKTEGEKGKEASDKSSAGKGEIDKDSNKGEVKATPKPTPKASPKSSPKPSPKKTDGN
jgi:hypothetical protein